jgi:hypothetical protein
VIRPRGGCGGPAASRAGATDRPVWCVRDALHSPLLSPYRTSSSYALTYSFAQAEAEQLRARLDAAQGESAAVVAKLATPAILDELRRAASESAWCPRPACCIVRACTVAPLLPLPLTPQPAAFPTNTPSPPRRPTRRQRGRPFADTLGGRRRAGGAGGAPPAAGGGGGGGGGAAGANHPAAARRGCGATTRSCSRRRGWGGRSSAGGLGGGATNTITGGTDNDRRAAAAGRIREGCAPPAGCDATACREARLDVSSSSSPFSTRSARCHCTSVTGWSNGAK